MKLPYWGSLMKLLNGFLGVGSVDNGEVVLGRRFAIDAIEFPDSLEVPDSLSPCWATTLLVLLMSTNLRLRMLHEPTRRICMSIYFLHPGGWSGKGSGVRCSNTPGLTAVPED